MDAIELIFIIFAAMPIIAQPFSTYILNTIEFSNSQIELISADSFDCGIAHFEHGREHRVVGGTNVFGWKYPWYGALIHTRRGQLACGANLISSKHLLTAAHCYDDYRKCN